VRGFGTRSEGCFRFSCAAPLDCLAFWQNLLFTPVVSPLGRGSRVRYESGTSPTGSVLVVHGNAGCPLDRGYIARPVREAASRDVYVLEYPGCGARAGSPSMQRFLAAGEEAFASLPVPPDHSSDQRVIGAGVASQLAKGHGDRVSGLMMFAPCNNLFSVGQRQTEALIPLASEGSQFVPFTRILSP